MPLKTKICDARKEAHFVNICPNIQSQSNDTGALVCTVILHFFLQWSQSHAFSLAKFCNTFYTANHCRFSATKQIYKINKRHLISLIQNRVESRVGLKLA